LHIQAGRDRRFVVDTWKKRFVSSHQWHDCPKSGLFPSFLGTQMHLNKDSPLKSKGFNPVRMSDPNQTQFGFQCQNWQHTVIINPLYLLIRWGLLLHPGQSWVLPSKASFGRGQRRRCPSFKLTGAGR